MSSHCFWFVYFMLAAVYKVKAVFILVLDKTTQITLYGGVNSLFVDLYKGGGGGAF